MANINGTKFNDNNTFQFNGSTSQFFAQINGTGAADNIFADAGDDIVFARGGNDIVDGGTGNDSLYGEAGDDNLIGNLGNDALFGGEGKDTLSGGAGNDFLDGGNGDDSLSGGNGNDILKGSNGDDTVDGGDGNDTADYSSLGVGISLQATGIVSKFGNFSFLGTDNLVSIETIIGSDNFLNSIDASGAFGTPASINVDLSSNSLQVLNIPSVGDLSFNVQNFADIFATSQSDRIIGNNLNNSIFASSGNDTIDGLTGNDSLFGENGNDTILGSAGNDFLSGDNGNDTLNGGDNADNLDGGSGDDSLLGGNGNDILFSGSGSDTLNGGFGNDTADYSFLNAPITLQATGIVSKDFDFLGTDDLVGIETIIGGFGFFNTIDASGANGTTASIDVNLDSNSLTVRNVPGIGFLSFNVQNFVSVNGTSRNDSIVGNNFANFIFGDAGSDFIQGGGGADSLDGGIGNDSIFGDGGNDSIFGFDGNDFLVGGNGNDFLFGENGNDELLGDNGSDELFGGNGNDRLIGGNGSDTLTGNAGADKFVFNSLAEGIDAITDFSFAQGDKIEVSQFGFGANSLNEFSVTADIVFFNGTAFATLQAGAGFTPNLDIVLV
jgi:Ca2+-binding RTX toxin-like protein